MASSLAQQLQKLAATSTSTLDTRKLKAAHSASLLFDRAHAATQGLDTIYSIALDGFRELCALDARFVPFEKSLFSEHSREVDRFVRTKEENAEIDASVEAFLELVSGRLLLKPAVKAVEWLVRRFRIHEQNTVAFILAFLPYHAHPVIFPMMLAILDVQHLPRELHFLRPYLSPAAPVPRHAITHALSHRRDFLDMLTSHVIAVVRARRDNHPLLSFFSAVVTEAVAYMCDAARTPVRTGITEETVLQKVLPVLDETYKARRSPEFQIGGYMLTTVVVSKIPVRDEVLLALMTGIVNGWSKESVAAGLACLALIAEARTGENKDKLSREVLEQVLAVEDMLPRLTTMGKKYRVDNLVLGLSMGVLRNIGQKYGEKELGYVIAFLESSFLGLRTRKAIFAALVETAQNLPAFDEGMDNEQAVRDILATRLLEWSEQGEDSTLGKTMQLVFKEHNVDVEMLELALRTVIRHPQITAGDEGVPKAIEGPRVEVVTVDSLLNSVSSTPKLVSALGPENKPAAEQLQQAFILASQKSADIAKLAQHAIFAGREDTDALYLSLLAKVWTSNASPILARAAALKEAAKAIKNSSKIDYQGLLPLVLVALADPAERVRREAATLVTVLKGVYGVDDGKKKKKGDGLQYWGYETLYGSGAETDNLKWLESADAGKFLEVVSRSLQECILDANFIGRVLEQGLGSAKKGDKTKEEGRLKSAVRSSVLMFLSSHVLAAPSVLVKYRLLKMINQIGKAPTSRTEFLLPVLKEWMVESVGEHEKVCEEERVELEEIERELVGVVAEGQEAESVQILVDIIDTHSGGTGLAAAAASRVIAIWKSLDEEVKTVLAENILSVRLKTGEDATGAAEATEILSNVELPTATFQSLLSASRDQLKAALGITTSGNVKRQKTADADDDAKSLAVTRITVVLELLESQGASNHTPVLPILFGILADVGTVDFSGITYMQSVILSCIREVIKLFKEAGAGAEISAVRADVLVSCIRSTTSPQVQNSALLLLSNLADVAPDTVKHSVMPIFTFMGANTLRQDDEYSAHVIEQTVRRIIPPLVKSLQTQDGTSVAGAAELVSTFVTSYKHVPTHRRLRLFLTLTETLGPQEFLFAILAKLAARYNTSEASTDIREFATQLMSEFNAEVQLVTVSKYLATVQDVLEPAAGGLASILFGDEEEVRPEDLIVRLLSVLRNALSSSTLKSNVSKALKAGESNSEALREHFTAAMQKTMSLGEHFVSNKPIYAEVTAVMDRLLELLSVVEFVAVIDTLISQENALFRRSALRTFKDRVINEYRADATAREAVLSLTPKIGGILSSDAPEEVKADALLCIQAVTTKFGKQDLTAIFNLTDYVVGFGGLLSQDIGLRVLAYVCLTHMATVLGGRIVPVLPKSVPVTIDYISTALKEKTEEGDMVHNAGFRYLRELVQIVPSFMTSYLGKLLPLCAASAVNEEYEDETAEEVRREFMDTVAEKVELKTLVAAFSKSFDVATQSGEAAVEENIDTVSKAVDHATKSTVQKSQSTLLGYFQLTLDLRRTFTEDVEDLEEKALQLVLDTVYKLNDSIFKPMFLRLIEWATEDLKHVDDTGKTHRTAALWKLLHTLSSNLKALVTDYFAYVLANAVEVLSSPHDEEPAYEAWKSVLRALHASFTTDDRDFWQSPTHFDPLFPALISQLSTSTLDDARELLYPAIVELAAASLSEEHNKTVNTAIMKAMRDEERWETRLMGVELLGEVYKRVGEEWLGLLPETVPVIAECMEDDMEEVEREVMRLVKTVEQYLGEGELEGMLT